MIQDFSHLGVKVLVKAERAVIACLQRLWASLLHEAWDMESLRNLGFEGPGGWGH